MNLSNVVQDLRINRMKQNQIQFGGSVGITQTYLSQIESGSKTPSSIILNRISEHIGIPLPILMYMSIEEKDIDKSKIESFRILNPKILELIKEFL